ncbi:MAG: hypothetical protein QOJ99_5408, partial [Bryobacterales bacterium]|nr:hypothetical protein [Bryobacterales bacterium]
MQTETQTALDNVPGALAADSTQFCLGGRCELTIP